MFPCGAPASSPPRSKPPPCWPPARMWWQVPSSGSGASSGTHGLAIDTTLFVCYELACSDWRVMQGKALTYALRLEREGFGVFFWLSRPRGRQREEDRGLVKESLRDYLSTHRG